jgi:hypothetical protein
MIAVVIQTMVTVTRHKFKLTATLKLGKILWEPPYRERYINSKTIVALKISTKSKKREILKVSTVTIVKEMHMT